MMPLVFGDKGSTYTVKRIRGKDDMKRHLNNLGFVEGGKVQIISEAGKDLIVNVKEARVAIGREIASKIVVE